MDRIEQFRSSLISRVWLSFVATVFTMMAAGDASGQKVKDAQAPPVPVPHSVNATIVNTEAQPVPVTGTVSVSNAGKTPLLIRDADKPARSVFQRQFLMNIVTGQNTVETSLRLPEGKLLIVEYVSATTLQLPGEAMSLLQIEEYSFPFRHFLDWRCHPEANCTASGPVKMQAGGTLVIRAARPSTSSETTVLVSVSGYLIDDPGFK